MKTKYYIRAVPIKLYTTNKKQNKLQALIQTYRKCVNQFLQYENLELNKIFLDKIQSKLSQRFKSNALKQAIQIQKSITNKKNYNGNYAPPNFQGHPNLDAKFIEIQEGKNSFDLWIKCSCLSKNKRIYLPSKKHKRLNYWMKKGKLVQGCELHKNKLILWIKIEANSYKEGKNLGIDLGINKLITTNEGIKLGTNFKSIIDKILATKPNSLARKRVLKERNNLVNRVVSQLPWDELGLLAYENLKDLKKGKNKNRGKTFRIRSQHWTYSKVIQRLIEKGQENRVRLVYVNPKNTSRTCPSCGNVDKANRKNEEFDCLTCGHKQDADIVGATNILNKALDWIGSLESPISKKGND